MGAYRVRGEAKRIFSHGLGGGAEKGQQTSCSETAEVAGSRVQEGVDGGGGCCAGKA